MGLGNSNSLSHFGIVHLDFVDDIGGCYFRRSYVGCKGVLLYGNDHTGNTRHNVLDLGACGFNI